MAKLIPDSAVVFFNPGDKVTNEFLNNLQVLAYGGVNVLNDKVLVKDGSVSLASGYIPQTGLQIATKGYVDILVQSGVNLIGSVDTYDDLPAGLTMDDTGDSYIVLDGSLNPAPYTGVNNVAYRWSGTEWIGLGPIFDQPVQDGTVSEGLQSLVNYELTQKVTDILDGSEIVAKAFEINDGADSAFLEAVDSVLNGEADEGIFLSAYLGATSVIFGDTDINFVGGALKLNSNPVELASNRLSAFQAIPLNTKYVSEKLVKDSLDAKENVINKASVVNVQPDNVKYPSVKAVNDRFVALKFTDLIDTPANYTDNAYYNVIVNPGENGVQFSRPNNNSSYAVLDGLELSQNAGNPNTFDIAPGRVVQVDATNPLFLITFVRDFAGAEGVTPTEIANGDVTYVSLVWNVSTLDIVQRVIEPSSSQRRQEAILGVFSHFDQATINDIQSTPVMAPQPLHAMLDRSSKIAKKEGLIYSGVVAAQSFVKSAGSLVGYGLNADVDQMDPDVRQVPFTPVETFVTVHRRAGGGIIVSAPTTIFDPTLYDDGSGTLVTIGPPDSNAVNHYFYTAGKGQTFVVYGQTVYGSITDAVTARVASTDIIQGIPNELLKNAVNTCIVSMIKGATDFSLAAEAVFYTPVASGGGGGGAVGAVIDANVNVTAVLTTLSGVNQKALSEDIDFYITQLLNDVDAPIIDSSVPYNGPHGVFGTSKDDLSVAIKGVNVLPVKNYKGQTLSQIAKNPFFKDDTEWSGITVSASIVGERLYNDGTNGSNKQVFQNVLSDNTKYYIAYDYELISGSVGVSAGGMPLVDDDVTVAGSGRFSKIYDTTSQNGNAVITFAINSECYIDNINIIPLPASITTVVGAEKLFSAPLEFGTWNLGSPKEFDQLLDNRNDFGNYITSGFTVDKITSQNNVPYMKFIGDGTSNNRAQVPISWVANNVYTKLTHILENTLDDNYRLINGSSIDGDTVDLVVGTKGVLKTLFTTGASPLGNSDELVLNTNSSGHIIIGSAILEGNHLNISDEEAIDIIEKERGGTFTRQGVTVKTIGKNKIDLLEQGSLGSGDGLEQPSTARLRTPDYIPVISGEQYTLASYNQKDATVLNQIVMQYDSGLNFLSTTGFVVTPLTLVLSLDTVYVKTVTKFITDADIEVGDILQQLELGAEDTIFEDYKELFTYNPTEKAGIGGVYDDDDYQRFDINKSINTLKAQTGWSITLALTNTHIFFKDLSSVLGYKLPVSNNVASNMEIGTETNIYTVVSESFNTTNDIEFLVSMNVFDDSLRVRVNKTTYPTTAEFEVLLQDLETLIFELAKAIPRSLTNNNESKWVGDLFTGVTHTFQQSSPQGVIGEFSVTQPLNLYGQLILNILTDLQQAKQISANRVDINALIEEVITIFEELGYLPNLDTQVKTDLVSAINEVLSNVGDLTTLLTITKVSTVAAINEIFLALASTDDDIFDLTPVELLAAPAAVGTTAPTTISLTASLAGFSRIKVFSFENGKPLPAVEINLADFGSGDYFYVTAIINETLTQNFTTKYRVTYDTLTSLETEFCTVTAVTFGSPADIPQPLNNSDVTVTSILGYR
jgi:hypothetical protein